jgi:hypothetical protein
MNLDMKLFDLLNMILDTYHTLNFEFPTTGF